MNLRFTIRKSIAILVFLLGCCQLLCAQVNVFNGGTKVFVGNGAQVYIGGNYIDGTPAGSPTMDGPLFLSGELHVTGDIINNSGNETNLIFPVTESPPHTGRVFLKGSGNRIIGGTATSFLPNLEVAMTGTAVLQNNITVANKLTFTSGNLDLGGRTIFLEANANIEQENNTRRIFGSGAVQTARYIINPTATDADYHGIGLGYSKGGGTDFSDVRWHRLHTPGNYMVADGVNILRVYKMETSTPQGDFSQITFRCLDAELNNITGTLAVYFSNDNGTSWTKAKTVSLSHNVVTGIHSVTAAGIHIEDTGDLDPTNLITLAVDNCNTAFKPLADFTSASLFNADGDMDICDEKYFDLHVPNDPDNDYLWSYAPASILAPTTNTTANYIIDPIAFGNEGTYEIFVRNKRGCENTNSLFVDVRAIPDAAFSATPDLLHPSFCWHSEVDFADLSTTSDQTAVTKWEWKFADTNNTTSTVKSPSFTYPTFGPQEPRLIAISEHGCRSDEVTKEIVIETLPIPEFKTTNGQFPLTICEDIDISFIGQSRYKDYNGDSTSTLSYDWNFGNGDHATAKDPVYAYNTFNTYTVTLTTKADYTQCTSQASKLITVNPEPIPLFVPRIAGSSISEACAGVYIDFDNASTMPAPHAATGITYHWDFDDGNTSTEIDPHKQFIAAAVNTVRLTATSVTYGCFESHDVVVTIHPPPTGDFTIGDPDICLVDEALFTNNSAILYGTLSYQWDFGDGSTSVESTPEVRHQYAIPMTQKITLTRLSDHGCTNSISRNLTVHPTPVPQFVHVDVCDKKEVTFYNNAVFRSDEIKSFQWDFGDLTASSEEAPKHLFPGPDVYNVTLRATSNFGCTEQITHPVEIFRNPGFNLGATIAGCSAPYTIDPAEGTDVFLPALSTFTWKNPVGEILANTPTLTVDTSGTYIVHITTTQSCEKTISLPVFLFKPADLGDDINACSQIVLDAEQNLPGERTRALHTYYEWRKGTTPISTSQTLTINESGDYSLTIIRETPGSSCSSSDDIHVDIELPLTIALPPEVARCEGETLILNAGVSADAYTWTNLNSGAVIGTESTVEVDASAVYRLEVTNASCTASAISTVIFSPLPEVSFDVPVSSQCTGQAVALTDYSFTSAGTIVSRMWDFGDGTDAADLSTINKTYAASGTYTILLTVTTSYGCSNSHSQAVTIKETPAAGFVAADNCAEQQISIQNTSLPNDADFNWSFGDGTESDVSQPAKMFDAAGSYDISLTATVQGCSSTVQHTVTVNPIPDLDLGGEITTCGNSLTLDAYNPGATYNWFDPQNSNNTLSTTQQHAVVTDGMIGLEITNSFGCSASDIATITLNTPIVINLGADRTVCDEEILDAGYFPGGQYTWTWAGGSEDTRTLQATVSGTYTLSVVDQNSCTSSDVITLQVDETPVVDLGEDQAVCVGTQLELSAGTNSAFNYLWSTGATDPIIQVLNAGIYSVTVTNGNCHAEGSVTLTSAPSPVAGFNAIDICSGENVSFSNSSTWSGTGSISHLWDFGDGTFSTLVDPVKTYSAAGPYSVTLKLTSPMNCVSEITRSLTIYPVPVAEFTVQDACTTNNLIISNTSSYAGTGALTYAWDFENATGNGFEPEHSYQASGTYYIQLHVSSENGCTDSYLQDVVIGHTPSLTQWQEEVSSCNTSLILDAGNAGSTYLWSDNSTSQTLGVSESDTYQVSITSPDGCSIDANVTVDFNNQVQPLLADVTEGCGSVLLDPGVSAASYLWSTGEQTQTIRVVSSSLYSIQVISTDLCVGNDMTTADVHLIPVIDLGNNREACDGETVHLNATASIPVTYAWSTGENTEAIQVNGSGNYSVILTTEHDCTFEDQLNVIFHQLPVLNLDDQATACGSLALDAQNPGSQYTWSTGSAQRAITVTQSGIYSVEVINVNNCSQSKSIDVTILSVPVVDLGDDVTVCNGKTTTLDAGTAGNQYQWSNNSTGRFVIAGSSGEYSVTVTAPNGCASTDAIRISVRPPLSLELGENKLLCNNSGIFLTAGVNNVTYEWGSDTGFSSQQKEVRPDKPGTYWLYIIDAYQCTAYDTVTVSPTTENITANFLVPSVVGQGDLVHFAQLSEPTPMSFFWTFGDGGLSTQENPQHRYLKTGEFTPTLVVSNGVCTDTLSKSISVRTGRFETEPQPPVLPEFIDIIQASLYPNPSKGIINLSLILTAEAEVWVCIYSQNGILMDEKRKRIMEELLEFDLSTASDGIYLLKIVVENKIKVIKLLKAGGY